VHKPIYLDYAATTPVDPRVLGFMLPYFTEKFGNPASRTHSFGWAADEAVKIAREKVAGLINCSEQELVFTSGATEAINLAIKGVFENYQSKGNHIVTAATEHRAVLDTCVALEKKGAEVTYLPVNSEGLIDLDMLQQAITRETILVCVMMANNETGILQPIRQIADIVHEGGSIFMCDATQAAGKISIDIQADHIDLLCLSAHKVYGPKGAGALFVRRKDPRVTLYPLIHGGGHESGLRSGTLNVPAIVGLGKAADLAKAEMKVDGIRISSLRFAFEQSLMENKLVRINGQLANRLPGISSISFKGFRAENLISKMPEIAVSAGSACSSGTEAPSHVLSAMGLNREEVDSTIRFSLGKYTSREEIEYVAGKLKLVIGNR
jgi:cysteine desulfurase